MRTIIFTIFILLSTLSFSQQNYESYHSYLNKSRIQKSKDSIIFYKEKAVLINNPMPRDLISLSFNYYQKKNFKKADYYFIESFKYGYQIEHDQDFDLTYRIKYDRSFIDNYRNAKHSYGKFITLFYDRNLKKIRKARKEYLKNINKVQDRVYEVLLQNEYNAQKVRLEILPSKKISDSLYQIVAKYSFTGNSYMMLDLLKNGNFPNRRQCRRFNNHTISMLLNHAVSSFVTKADAEEFINLLWDQVNIGNLTPKEYAAAMDHYTQWYIDSELTLLGTVSYLSEDFKNTICMDVLYPEKLNELRKKYWLPTIEDYCNSLNYKLPSNYVVKEN